ncbi:MAG: hypothetical protein WBM83_01945 [Flavobacteriaceae bacterium]
MKKTVAIFAVVLMSAGLFTSVDTNTSGDSTDVVVVQQDTQACDGCHNPKDSRGTE